MPMVRSKGGGLSVTLPGTKKSVDIGPVFTEVSDEVSARLLVTAKGHVEFHDLAEAARGAARAADTAARIAAQAAAEAESAAGPQTETAKPRRRVRSGGDEEAE